MTEDGPVISDSLGGRPLVYSNEQPERFVYSPAEIEVRVTGAALRRVYGLAKRLRLSGPPGWVIEEPDRLVLDPARALCWRVRPAGEPPSCLVNLVLQISRPDEGITELVHALPVEIRGRTQFDPRYHALPFANAAAEFGEVAPQAAVFDETYRSKALAGPFFRGLYSDVVYLTGDRWRPRPGGLCTGIARSTLEYSLQEPAGRIARHDPAVLRRAAQVWHGKQLADRALLASTAAWVRHGSRDAYLAFRRAVLAHGRSELAMDVNVPRPWRRDIVRALVGSGHTVVPYALRQRSDDRADVWVYDPNYPRPEQMRDSVIHFDLANDSYTYRHYDGRQPGRPSKVIAVHQDCYRAADTAYLSGLLSLALYPRAWWPEGRLPAPLVAAAIVFGLLLGLLFGRGGPSGPLQPAWRPPRGLVGQR
jgi:hypothetical protein